MVDTKIDFHNESQMYEVSDSRFNNSMPITKQ